MGGSEVSASVVITDGCFTMSVTCPIFDCLGYFPVKK